MSNQSNMPPCILSAWELHESELHHWLLRQLGNQEDAADALHDIFLKTVSKGITFCEIDNPCAWLFQVARNYLADTYRKTRTFTELTDISGSEFTHENKTKNAAVDALTQCLPRLLTELVSEDSDIIRCCDIDGMSLQQYADKNKLTLPATKSRIQRARKRLRDQMIQKCQVKMDEQGMLRDHQLICSMSAKGCCYDNACSESFFHSLKVEALHGERFETRAQMRETVFEYIEVDYNRQRLHSYLDYKSPDEFEQQKIA